MMEGVALESSKAEDDMDCVCDCDMVLDYTYTGPDIIVDYERRRDPDSRESSFRSESVEVEQMSRPSTTSSAGSPRVEIVDLVEEEEDEDVLEVIQVSRDSSPFPPVLELGALSPTYGPPPILDKFGALSLSPSLVPSSPKRFRIAPELPRSPVPSPAPPPPPQRTAAEPSPIPGPPSIPRTPSPPPPELPVQKLGPTPKNPMLPNSPSILKPPPPAPLSSSALFGRTQQRSATTPSAPPPIRQISRAIPKSKGKSDKNLLPLPGFKELLAREQAELEATRQKTVEEAKWASRLRSRP